LEEGRISIACRLHLLVILRVQLSNGRGEGSEQTVGIVVDSPEHTLTHFASAQAGISGAAGTLPIADPRETTLVGILQASGVNYREMLRK
jgi:hypothetical protein